LIASIPNTLYVNNLNVKTLGTGAVYSNSGQLTNTNPSDINLKTKIEPIKYSLSEIQKLNPVSFYWKCDTNKEKQFGFIAQEVKEILPDSIVENENGQLGLNKDAIYMTMVRGMQELKKENDELKDRLNKLEDTLNKILEKII
jgi:hypothetical protein